MEKCLNQEMKNNSSKTAKEQKCDTYENIDGNFRIFFSMLL